MTPTKYVILTKGGRTTLMGLTPDVPKGYFVVESIAAKDGIAIKPKTMEAFRKHARKLAKHWSVEI